jgi:hypothetical protein
MFRVLIGAAAQPLKLAFSLQRPTWSSPKGPGSLFDDDDNISMRPHTNQSGGKHHQSTSQALLAESDSDDGGQISAGSGPNLMPESPTRGRRKMASEPPKSHRQKAYDFEVCEYISLA